MEPGMEPAEEPAEEKKQVPFIEYTFKHIPWLTCDKQSSMEKDKKLL